MILVFMKTFSFVYDPAVQTSVCRLRNIVQRSVVVFSGVPSLVKPDDGGELQLLTHLDANKWAESWSKYAKTLDQDQQMCESLQLQEITNIYTTENYFYFGYFPQTGGQTRPNEPKYIAVFALLHKKRILSAKLVVVNPKFIYESSNLLEFENALRKLCDDSYVFFKYDELKRPGQMRYYLSFTFS